MLIRIVLFLLTEFCITRFVWSFQAVLGLLWLSDNWSMLQILVIA